MEMSENGVEHQATVDKGLKMKIKRKQPGSKTQDTKGKLTNDESVKAQKNTAEAPVIVDSKPSEDDAGSVSLEVPSQKSQKRKRNNKNGRNRDSEAEEKLNGELDNRGKCRDLCNVSKTKDISGCTNERSSNRKRQITTTQDLSTDAKDSGEDKELRNKISSKNPEYGTPALASNGEKQDIADVSDRDSILSDPYEFVSRVEDQHQTPVKKYKSEKMESELPSSSSSSSSSKSSCSSSSSSSKTKCDVGTVTYSVGVMTDPDCLGPCEPGTSVILEGIVWSESNNGILVVNVTWRGKTYVGTLMDATKHHWASPRFREESPSVELDYRVPKSKRGTPVTEVMEGRRLRKCRRSATSTVNSGSGSGTNKTMVTRQSPPIGLDSNGRQRSRTSDQSLDISAELMTAAKRAKLDIETNDETLYKCMAPDCSKKFKHISGLRYHQSQAHKKQWTKKPDSALNSDLAQGKAKTEKQKDESFSKLCYDPVEPVCLALDQEVGNEISTSDVMESVEKTVGESVRKVEADVIPCLEILTTDSNAEQNSGGDLLPDPSDVSCVSVSVSAASADVSASIETCEALTQPICHSDVVALERKDEDVVTAMTNDHDVSDSYLIASDVLVAISNGEMNPSDVTKASDFREKSKSRVGEIEAEKTDRDMNSTTPSGDVFHKPILRTPEIAKHKSLHHSVEKCCPRIESNQSLTVLRPQNIGLKLSPPVGWNCDDKSPVYSDISDANDGTFSENEMRLRRTEKESKRMLQKFEKPPLRKYEDYGSPSAPSNSSFRQSPFHSASSSASSLGITSQPQSTPRKQNEPSGKSRDAESDQAKQQVGIAPVTKPPLSGMKPIPPGNDMHRTEKSSLTSDFSVDMLQLQENGRLWMEMLQRSNLTQANMMPYSYGIDPLAHMQLMASNPDYRNYCERIYMGNHYRHALQAESERCLAVGDKPVDMSAKSAAVSVASNVSDLKSKTMNQKMPSRPPVNHHSAPERTLPDKHRDSVGPLGSLNSLSEYPKSTVHSHHEKNSLPRDKLLVPKQESVRPRTAEKDEKPLDLMNQLSSTGKAKSKQLDGGVGFPVSSPNPVIKSKVLGLSSSTGKPQDFTKVSSLPQVRYDGTFAQFPGFPNQSYLDSATSSANRYPASNSKCPAPGSFEKSLPGTVGATRKTGQLTTTPLSLKGLSPAEKHGSHQQNSDSFDFRNENSIPEKPSTSSSSGHTSPLTLRHLHTHHHTHVVGAAPYSLYGSYNGLMSPVPTIVPPVVPVIPPTYLPK